jgi:tRNA pseudouridine38-40 synthase
MTRWKITLEYDGGGFSGWQRQENAPSVQQTVEESIASFCGEEVRLQVAGRTDAGVHALAQVAHFDIQKPAEAETIRDALNYYLREKPVCILQAESVGEDFHARFSAKARHYLYRVVNRKPPLVLERSLASHVTRELKREPMQKAADLLLGTHDFSTFRAQNCQAKSPNKTMDVAQIEQVGDEFCFLFSARSFLYHQVRNMVGTLLLVGTGQWSLENFKTAFDACDRTKGGPTAPSQGLYFVRVDY